MPNWCFTSYVVTGEEKEVCDLYEKMLSLEEREESLVENGFGKSWLGNLVTLLGGDWNTIYCRGEWEYIEKDEDGKADMSEDTLGTLINGKNKDCNMSTVIKIAKALGVSLDENYSIDLESNPYSLEEPAEMKVDFDNIHHNLVPTAMDIATLFQVECPF